MRISLLIAALLCLSGCAAHRPLKAQYFVGPECHASARLYGCGEASPPDHCQRIVLKFDRGCEKLDVKP